MYKDFKKTESLDTGFVGGSGIIWMFSGIAIGLLVGLGMYYFSNLNTSNTPTTAEMAQTSEQAVIKQSNQLATSSKIEQAASQQAANQQEGANPAGVDNLSMVDQAEREQQENANKKKKDSKFSYYAVLPNLNVPVGSVKAVDVRESARDRANIPQVSATKKGTKLDSNATIKSKGKNKAAMKPGKGKYFLQIASFKRKSIANAALRKLVKRGVKAHIQKKKIKGRLWYRISVGSLDKKTAYRWKKIAEKIGHKPRVSQ